MTENELLNELERMTSLPEIDPDEITVQMLAARTGLSENSTRNRLNLLVEQGILTSRWVRTNANKARAYRKLQK